MPMSGGNIQLSLRFLVCFLDGVYVMNMSEVWNRIQMRKLAVDRVIVK